MFSLRLTTVGVLILLVKLAHVAPFLITKAKAPRLTRGEAAAERIKLARTVCHDWDHEESDSCVRSSK